MNGIQEVFNFEFNNSHKQKGTARFTGTIIILLAGTISHSINIYIYIILYGFLNDKNRNHQFHRNLFQ
jgi:hypothetical protein